MPLTHNNYFPLLRKVLPQHEGVPYNSFIFCEIPAFYIQIELAFLLLGAVNYSPEVAVFSQDNKGKVYPLFNHY